MIEVGDLVDPPVVGVVLMHLIQQAPCVPAGSAGEADVDLHFSIDGRVIVLPAADHVSAKCFDLGVAEDVEIDEATIIRGCECHRLQQQSIQGWGEALALTGEGLDPVVVLLHLLHPPAVQAIELIDHALRASCPGAAEVTQG